MDFKKEWEERYKHTAAPLKPTPSEMKPQGTVHSAWDCGTRWDTLVPRINEYSKDRNYHLIYNQFENCRQARIADYERRLRQGYPEDFIHPYNIRMAVNMMKFLNEVVAPGQQSVMALIFDFNSKGRPGIPFSFIATIYSYENKPYEYEINGEEYKYIDRDKGGKRKKTHKRKNKKAKTRRNHKK